MSPKWFCLLLLTAALLISAVAADDSETDPILDFYWKRAAETFKSRDPIGGGVAYSMTVKTLRKQFNRHGRLEKTDSSVVDYFFSFGQLDSAINQIEPTSDRATQDLDFPNIFLSGYDRNFFPNDTGGTGIAIGFDSYTAADDRPVGLALIDRKAYYLQWLYLHFPNKSNYRHFSRSFRFVEHEGYIFPDSIWEVGDKQAFFSTGHYRRESSISNIRIHR